MPAIQVEHLRKTFRTKRKAPGLMASVRSLWRPDWHSVEAVRDISFAMEQGELLGFIGPNGAGKSTTIKILTGILHPTSGEANVLGFTPWRERYRLAFQIGSVFGQRPQLWYHLPAVDTFYLFGKIYEMEDADLRRRIAYLAEVFEIAPLLETPVRKLSLGQRMRCEVAASLLHRPKLLLLDEPSIGLDVVAKQRLREIIRVMNEQEGVGVLLTSHDAGDIEALCKRVIIINHGEIVYQDKVSSLKRRYLTSKQVDVRYSEPLPRDFAIPGVEMLKVGKFGAKLRFHVHQTPVEQVMAHLAEAGSLVDVTVSDPSLEEVIRIIYEQDEESRPTEALP
ncbi:MAG: ATP-binding cassette domain-containing protein [Caldilineae bacterium]|nr:MAG: ATP-binding cassette domain-containing protein [Caldilineae bacterium]